MAGTRDTCNTTANNNNGSVKGGWSEWNEDSFDCPICLEPCSHPIRLPCRHASCFFCIKELALNGPQGNCPICLEVIPSTVLANPLFNDASEFDKDPKLPSECKWYLESRTGGSWAKYDERSRAELEDAFCKQKATCKLLLDGKSYVVDFMNMVQYPSSYKWPTSRAQRIRRRRDATDTNLENIAVAGTEPQNNNSVVAGVCL